MRYKILNMSVFEESWNFQIDINQIDEKCYHSFVLKLHDIRDTVIKLIETNFVNNYNNYITNNTQIYDEELKKYIDDNKELRLKLDTKLKDITQQQGQYENFKKSQKLLSQEIKETHEAFLMAKKQYKKFLKIYFTIESRNYDNQVIYLQFFTEAKKDSENYSVQLLRSIKTGQYELVSTNPKLKGLKEIQRRLQETNDTPGALCCIRESFMMMKGNKNVCKALKCT